MGQPTTRRNRKRRVLLVAAILLAGGAVFGAPHYFQSGTTIQQAPAATTTVAVAEPQTQDIAKPAFKLSLPKDWREDTMQSRFTEYSWQGTLKTDDARRLDVYVDNLPTDLAVNRLLPLRAEAAGVTAAGAVSDNCINFTDKKTANPLTGAAPAKWAGVSFLCDTANSLREVVGSGSADGINLVKVQGASGNMHSFFFVYTDHSAQADFSVLTEILDTFKAQ